MKQRIVKKRLKKIPTLRLWKIRLNESLKLRETRGSETELQKICQGLDSWMIEYETSQILEIGKKCGVGPKETRRWIRD